jgi:hypothetical protein
VLSAAWCWGDVDREVAVGSRRERRVGVAVRGRLWVSCGACEVYEAASSSSG